MLKNRFTAVAVALAGLAMGATLLAPGAMAYPPNPPVPVVIANTIVITNQATAAQATPTAAVKPAKLADAPKLTVKKRAVVAVGVKGLPKSTMFTVRVYVQGTWVKIGRTLTNSKGYGVLPAIRILRSGNYKVMLTAPNGTNYYLVLSVA